MALKATCPNNPEHKKFYTTAHVMQEWIVDEEGNFLEMNSDLGVDHGPDPGNIWTCSACGKDAKVEILP